MTAHALTQRIRNNITDIFRAPGKLVVFIIVIGMLLYNGFDLWSRHNANEVKKLAGVYHDVMAIGTAAVAWDLRKGGAGRYDDVTVKTLVGADLLPSNFASNPYGGTYSITGTGKGFAVAATNLPVEACEKLVIYLTQAATVPPTCSKGTIVIYWRSEAGGR